MGTTPTLGLPYPELSEPADVPTDMRELATALDALAPGYVPVGSMMMWPTGAAPTNWLLCDGTQVSAATYPALATILGASGGLITLPALAQRVPMGAGGAYALNGTGGAATVALAANEMPTHNHANGTLATDTEAAHTHGAGTLDMTQWAKLGASGGSAPYMPAINSTGAATTNVQDPSALTGITGNTAAGGAHSHALTGAMANAGGGAAHENLPPYFVVNFIIRAK